MPNGITLYPYKTRQHDEWRAIFTGPHAASVISLFGTANLPLAWNTQAKPEDVLIRVKRGNPGVEVTLDRT